MFSELFAEPAVGEALGGQIRSAKGYCCMYIIATRGTQLASMSFRVQIPAHCRQSTLEIIDLVTSGCTCTGKIRYTVIVWVTTVSECLFRATCSVKLK